MKSYRWPDVKHPKLGFLSFDAAVRVWDDSCFGPSKLPCCGVTALAIARCVTFDYSWQCIARRLNKSKSWKGRLDYWELIEGARELGVELQPLQVPKGATLDDFHRDNKDVQPAPHFIVALPRHYLAYINSYVGDQYLRRPTHVELALPDGWIDKMRSMKVKQVWRVDAA